MSTPQTATVYDLDDYRSPRSSGYLKIELERDLEFNSETQSKVPKPKSGGHTPMVAALKLNKERDVFTSQLMQLIEETPIEDGLIHPGEDLISTAFRRFGDTAMDWVQTIWGHNQDHPVIAASILKCLAACDDCNNINHLHAIIPLAVRSTYAEILEAAINAVELTEDKRLAQFLRDTPLWGKSWLDEYKNNVCAELLGE